MGARETRETPVGDAYQDLRPYMFAIAYRMVGSVSDAEDIVQEAFLRFHRVTSEGEVVESPKAYLSAVTTRLGIDHLRSARVRRESYVGQWLPEPLITDQGSDVAQHAETADSLSLAFLVLLESLSPVERAVFLLRDVFGYGYGEIARVVDKSEENCRQIAVRARRQVDAKKPRFEASRQRKEELARRFFGRDRVARLLASFRDRAEELRVTSLQPAAINGQPGAVFFDPEGHPIAVVSLDIADDQVQAIRAVSNPDKLSHLRGID